VPIEPDNRLVADAVLRVVTSDDSTVDAVIEQLLHDLAVDVAADRASVTLINADGTIENSHEWTGPGVAPHRPVIKNLHIRQFPYTTELARAGQTLRIGSPNEWPADAAPETESFGAFGVRAVLQAPILLGSELIGFIAFNQLTDRTWDDRAVGHLHTVGRAIALALAQRMARDRIRRSREVAELANRAKDDLISRAGHELRTPLHAVLGFAELLELDGVQHTALHQIRANGRLLLSMIDDLLELSQFTSQTDDDDDVPVAALLSRVVEALEPVAAARSVTLMNDTSHQVMTSTSVAPRLHQGLHCVTAAAIANAARGGTVRVTSIPGAYPCVEVTVHGTRGNPPSELGMALARSFLAEVSAAVSVAGNDETTTMLVRLS
jgi:signal transduction histidine kinase